MAQMIVKNTFISFVNEENGAAKPDYANESARSPLVRRSQSAEISRNRPIAEEQEEKTQQALQRLHAALSEGIASPTSSPTQQPVGKSPLAPGLQPPSSHLTPEQETRPGPAAECPPPAGFPGLADLQTMRERSVKASRGYAQKTPPRGPSSPFQKPWDRHHRVASSCSLSTMAPDDASECGELPRTCRYQRVSSGNSINSLYSAAPDEAPEGGARRVPRVGSSGSVNSLASEHATERGLDEDGQVRFALSGLDEDGEAHSVASGKLQCNRSSNNVSIIHEGDMRHSRVPKTQNLEELYNQEDTEEPPTTMMIRNIPGRYSQHDLMMDLKDLGLGGTYNFLYMPVDKGTAASVGYAFVNFVEATWAQKCRELFSNYRFQRHRRSSHKVATVSVAHLQGLEKNLQHYENSAVNMSKEKRRRPVVMANIAQIVE